MPAQRKKKRQQQAGISVSPGAGEWQVIFETQNESEWQAHLRRLRAGPERIDWARIRVDTLCGRLMQATTYRLSVFVPGPSRGPDPD